MNKIEEWKQNKIIRTINQIFLDLKTEIYKQSIKGISLYLIFITIKTINEKLHLNILEVLKSFFH